MNIIISNSSSTPIYEQIEIAIKQAIFSNELKEEEMLPSVRVMANDLKISFLTVKKAYDKLEKDGFIIDHKDEASKLLLRTAESLFPQKQCVLVKTETINEKLNSVFEQEESLKQRIRILKKAKDFCCYNPIAYCELARCYTILGQQDKAEEMMNIALHLAPAHRYISRSAARLFLHLGDHDKAHYIVSHTWQFFILSYHWNTCNPFENILY